MMRVLMFGWEFPPYMSGGLGTACYDMTRALANKGTKIIFVQPQVAGVDKIDLVNGIQLKSASGTSVKSIYYNENVRRAVDELWNDNLTVHSVDSALINPYFTPQTYDEYLRNLIYSRKDQSIRTVLSGTNDGMINLHGGYGADLMSEVYRYSYAAAEIALQEDFDVIHAHDWMTYLAGIVAKNVTGKPLFVHAHALEFDRSSGSNVNSEIAHIEWMGYNAADKVIAVSNYTKSLIMKHYNISEDKIEVVHNAVSKSEAIKRYNMPPLCINEKRVLFLGRITYQKGPDYFVEAARLVLDKLPKTRFVMAGTGDMMLNLVRRVGQLRMGKQFHFTGFMNRKEIERTFALSDLYVMPSVSEPFGITPLEAMASDVPVLISNQSGVSEVLRGALKVDFWDVREMANKICAVLTHPVLKNQVTKNCREDLINIRWENAAELLNSIYAQHV